jgi:hypothetical protein
MMNRFLLLGTTLCLLLLTSFRTTDDWITFASETGHYAITLPGKPTNEYVIEKEIHMLAYAPPESGVYLLTWRDMNEYYPGNHTIKKMLKEGMNEAAVSIGATGLTETHTEINEVSYIEFAFKTPDYMGKGRIYIVHAYQYSLIVTGPLKNGFTPNMDRFLKSFQYLP